jgi:histidinol-phosphate aminotransferase
MDTFIKAVVSERVRLFREMEKIQGIKPFPSEANFILFQVKNTVAVYNSLLKKGVLVRNMNNGVKGCLRVTVGTPGENTAFLKALKEILKPW